MVEPTNANLSIRVQCRLLSISQSDWYYDPKGSDPLSLKLMGLIDKQFCRHLIMVVARWLVTLAGWVIVLGDIVYGDL
jgi:hypothetical protein